MAKRNYGFISNKERNKRVRQSNQSYGLRKIFITLTVVSLVVLVVFAILTIATFGNVAKEFADGGSHAGGTAADMLRIIGEQPFSIIAAAKEGTTLKVTLSGFGWFMAIWAVVTLALAIVSLVLMLTMKSPKAAKANINRLQSAAISGKKLESHANAAQVYRERATNSKKLKKGKK